MKRKILETRVEARNECLSEFLGIEKEASKKEIKDGETRLGGTFLSKQRQRKFLKEEKLCLKEF